MILITVSRKSIAHKFSKYNPACYVLGAWHVMVAGDGKMGRTKTVDDCSCTAFETPHGLNSPIYVLGMVDYKKRAIRITKSTLSGRPLYYHINNEGEFFCSTHVSNLREAGISLREDEKHLPEYFIYRLVMPPNTLFSGIKQLMPGDTIELSVSDESGVQLSSMRFFNPAEDIEIIDTSEKDLVGIGRSLLEQSLAELSPIHERITVFLSGGLDSSLLFSMAQKKWGIKKTFSTCYPFELPSMNKEKSYALDAANAFGASHSLFECSSREYLVALIDSIAIAEEPIHHLQSPMIYLLYNKASLQIEHPVILSGLGAGTFFGLHSHFDIANQATNFFRLVKQPIGRVLSLLNIAGIFSEEDFFSIDGRLNVNHSIDDPANVLWATGAYGSWDWVCSYFGITRDKIVAHRARTLSRYKGRSAFDLISFLDYFADAAVTQSLWGKLAEYFGAISYNPFTEDKFINYACNIPWNIRLKAPKHVLKNIARSINVPEFIITRPKSGFGIRNPAWAAPGGLFEPLISLSNAFSPMEMRTLQGRDPSNAMIFWNMINYALWKRLFILGQSVEDLQRELAQQLPE